MSLKYKIENTLASGSTGIVKRATYLNKTYAVKIINVNEREKKEVLKEIKIHSMLDHQNIIKFIDHYETPASYFIVMQLADVELFDLIEPDEGLNSTLIHFYFRQLMSAVNYLHENGIVHRDIKPENILLDHRGNLLLSDFGYSTLYMYKGKKRRLNNLVGSYRYMAPEVIRGDYDNQVDIWSMGMLLLVMFTGRTPWEKPIFSDDNFVTYLQMRDHDYPPFNKLSPQILKLYKKMCTVESNERLTLKKMFKDEWLGRQSEIEDERGLCKDKYLLIDYISPKIVCRISFSQPEKMNLNNCGKNNIISSQPNFNTFDLPCLKRIYVMKNTSEIILLIENLLSAMIVPFSTHGTVIAFSTVDRQKIDLIGEINITNMNTVSCVSFTRVKGDCIEFKRFFNILSEKLKDI